MARVKQHPHLSGLTGAIGDMVYYPNPNDNGITSIVQKKGVRREPLSPAQLAHNDRVKLAAIYGNMVKRDPVLAEIYRPFCRGRMTPYHAALRDYLRPPVVHAIDATGYSGKAGQLIQVHASDDTQVVSVHVTLRTADQAVVEEGPAALSTPPGLWAYTARTELAPGTIVSIEAKAVDRPEHAGTATVQHVIV